MHQVVGFRRKFCIKLLYLIEKQEKKKNTASGGVSKKILHWIILSNGEVEKEGNKCWVFRENVVLNYYILWKNKERMNEENVGL